MTREGIKNKVMAIIADKIGFSASEIKEDTSFKYDLGTDSLDEVEIVMEFEREFGITIKDEELMSVGKVGEAIDVICKKLDVPICKQQKPEVDFEDIKYLLEKVRCMPGYWVKTNPNCAKIIKDFNKRLNARKK